MDPITAAIIGGAAVGVASGLTEVSKKLVVDAYEALKAALQQKFGTESDLVDAVNKLDKDPNSKARKEFVAEEVAKAKAAEDQQLVELAEAVTEKMQAQPGVQQVYQQAIGSYIAQASGGSTASVNVNQPKKE